MKFWVGVTDKNWFEYLASINPDEVNFWKPGGQGFGAIELGSPFLFKLKSPNNVSRKIKEEFNNGKHYYTFHGKELYKLPDIVTDRTSPDFIRWHNENVYK